jgi:N4-gp56 family major capsid protein
MGTGSDKIIQVGMDLTKQKGDRMTFKMLCQLTGSGQTDDGTYVSNAQTMYYRAFQLDVHERGTDVALNGQMTEQSALGNLRQDAKVVLADWEARVEAREIIDSLSGLTAKSFAGQITGANAVNASPAQIYTVQQVAPTRSATAKRYFCGGQTAAGVLSARVANTAALTTTTGYLFGEKVIDALTIMAKRNVDASGNLINPIRPIVINGIPHWLLLIDPYQGKALRACTDWQNAQQNIGARDLSNPIFSGMMGMWNNVVVKECDGLHRRTGAGAFTAPEYFDATSEACASGITVARALFLGAQACAVGWAQLPNWSDGYSDPPSNTKWQTHTHSIRGVKKFGFSATLESDTTGTVTPLADSELGCIICDTTVIL